MSQRKPKIQKITTIKGKHGMIVTNIDFDKAPRWYARTMPDGSTLLTTTPPRRAELTQDTNTPKEGL